MAILPAFNKDSAIQAGPGNYTVANLLAANTPEFITVPTDENGLKAKYVTFGKGQATTDNFYAQVFNTTTGSDPTVNGTFAADTNWTKGAGWTIAAGVATAAGATNTDLSQVAASPYLLVEGQSYYCTFTITAFTAGTVALSLGGGTAGTARGSAATFSEIITAGSTQTILFDGAGATLSIDNLTILPCAQVPIDNTTGKAAIQNPQGFLLNNQASVISLVSAATPIITTSFFK